MDASMLNRCLLSRTELHEHSIMQNLWYQQQTQSGLQRKSMKEEKETGIELTAIIRSPDVLGKQGIYKADMTHVGFRLIL